MCQPLGNTVLVRYPAKLADNFLPGRTREVPRWVYGATSENCATALSNSCSRTWHATLEMSPVYVFTSLPGRFGLDGRPPRSYPVTSCSPVMGSTVLTSIPQRGRATVDFA